MNTSNRKWLRSMIILLTATFLPVMAMAEMTDQQKIMINQLDQLDQLDHLEFTAQTDKANTCILARDYSCAEKKIAKAARYAINSADRNTLRLVKQSLAAERRREQEELEAVAVEQARQMQLAEEQRRIAQAEQRQREAGAEASGFQWGKAGLGIGVGLLAGGRMSSEAKIQYIEGIVKDSMPGQEGLSNTTANANAYADKQKALKIIADEQSRQQLLKGIAEETANNERLLKASRESRQPKTSDVEQSVARADAQRNAYVIAAKSQTELPTYLPLGNGNGGADAQRYVEPRKTEAEPDPYRSSYDGTGPDRWKPLGSGKGNTREAACSEAESRRSAEIVRLSEHWRLDAVSPCVCDVNYGASRSVLDAMAEGGWPDNWRCGTYWKSTQIKEYGAISK